MYEICDKVINFITIATKSWKVELTRGGKPLAEGEILEGIFLRDALSALLFAIEMMPPSNILRKCTKDNKFTKS